MTESQVSRAIEHKVTAHLGQVELLWTPDPSPHDQPDLAPDGARGCDCPHTPTPWPRALITGGKDLTTGCHVVGVEVDPHRNMMLPFRHPIRDPRHRGERADALESRRQVGVPLSEAFDHANRGVDARAGHRPGFL